MIPLDTYVSALQAGYTAQVLAQHMSPTEADHIMELDTLGIALETRFPGEIEAARLRLSWLGDELTSLTYDSEIERNLP